MSAPKRILFISNDAKNTLQKRIETVLSKRDYELLTTPLKDGGLEIAVAEMMPELIIVDLSMSLQYGLLACLMLRTTSSVPILALTAGDEGTLQFLDTNARDHLSAPFYVSRLERVINAVLYQDGEREIANCSMLEGMRYLRKE